MAAVGNRPRNETRDRNAFDAAATTRSLTWFFVLLTALLAAAWFVFLMSRTFTQYFNGH